MEFRDRFAKVLQVMGTNASRLSREVGGTTAKYYKLLKGESEPNLETIVSLLKRYPEISTVSSVPFRGETVPDRTAQDGNSKTTHYTRPGLSLGS